MKVTYIEEIENHTAFSRKMYCHSCGAHEYEIVHQWEPRTPEPFSLTTWYVRCPQCGAESVVAPTKDSAIRWWKSL